MEPLVGVSFLALLTALATGLGALPFVFEKHPSRRWLGLSNAGAAGLMLAASLGLVYEGLGRSVEATLLGALLGVGAIALVRRSLRRGRGAVAGAFAFEGLDALDARKALLVVGVMTAHSFPEGVAVGVSFGGGAELGLFIALAIAIHNVPEGLAISLVLVPRGVSWSRAALWSVFSSLPQPLMALPAFLFVQTFGQLLPWGLGFAAGAMVWLALSELLPDALEEAPANLVLPVLALSALALLGFQALIL